MKNYKMLRLVLTMICTIFLFTARGQHNATASSYEGVWAGLLSKSNNNEDKAILIIQVSNGVAARYSYNKETKKLEKSSFLKETTTILGNNLSYTWMNKSTLWSETQTHLISYLKPDLIMCRLIRQVTNVVEGKESTDRNGEWSTYYLGSLTRFKSIQEVEEILAK